MNRLLLDVMLGKLTTYLRMCGYDAAYALDRGIEADDEIRQLAREEERTLVTRDADLAARTDDAILLSTLDITDQLRELQNIGFELTLTTPARCANCNTVLELVPDDATTPEYAPSTDDQSLWRCPNCGQHYWNGSHWADVETTLEEL